MMNSARLKEEIDTILRKDFNIDEVHARTQILTNAIAQAVVAHIQKNAKTIDLGPYSGQWKIL